MPKALALSKSQLKNVIKISINNSEKKKRRRRRRKSHTNHRHHQQQQPQIVVVSAPQAPPNPWKRDDQVQMSAHESNRANALKTRENLAAQRPPPQNNLGQQPPVQTQIADLLKSMPPSRPPRLSTADTPPQPSRNRSTLNLFGPLFGPPLTPIRSPPESPPPNVLWRGEQATQTQLPPTERRTSPPLSPSQALDLALRRQVEFVLDHLVYAPLNAGRASDGGGRNVYTPQYLQALTDPATVRRIYEETKSNLVANRPVRPVVEGGGIPFASPPPPQPRDRRRDSGLF